MMASTLEVLKEKQLRLVELIVTHEQHENKMHEEDEVGLGQKIRRCLKG